MLSFFRSLFGGSLPSRLQRLIPRARPRDDVPDAEVIEAIRAVPTHFTALTTLTSTWTQNLTWNATLNLSSTLYNAQTSGSTVNKSQSVGTAVANAVSGGGDEMFCFEQGITAGSTATINLNSLTDVMGRTAQAQARVKCLRIRLLSATDDSTISPAPTATSTVTVTNIGPAVPSPLDFGNGGSGGTVALTQAAGVVTAVAVGVGGTGYPASTFFLASPQQAAGSGNVFLCGTNGSGVITSMTFIAGAGGAGYSNATVPLVPVGQYNILTGGSHMYFDGAAAGFLLVSATSRAVNVINMDTVNAVTVEIADVGGST